ncbi:MAG TPA: hypothetical protein VKF32_11775, partial [Thermoanaerobaculia bacterium]|nr:hypothetical protein [Thermoanaerobaculia bacterium]
MRKAKSAAARAAAERDVAPTALPEERRAPRALLALASAFFFLSGATGLVYQVLWSRELQRFFGSTTEAVSVVLATFMAGL